MHNISYIIYEKEYLEDVFIHDKMAHFKKNLSLASLGMIIQILFLLYTVLYCRLQLPLKHITQVTSNWHI